ncbi:MAG: YjbQ family protein [Deltaproteobacteria bacterium]|uniref:secondary thiamine-phosphate synthase enzyme YjbQ n=1 Tax=Hydrosulfovibrio ferrireducens TaxID=2934181 RepID=UPI0011FE4F66|nr:MAG: YjbQ family protein [Deltaproteobacteria bacterium]
MPAGTLVISTLATMQFSDITAQLQKAVTASTVVDGVCHVYNPHTTAGLTINEGAAPDVQADILAALQKIVPQIRYRHGEGNSPAHVMASLTGSSVTVFIENGRLQLGTWQKIFFCEFDGPRSRKVLWRIA